MNEYPIQLDHQEAAWLEQLFDPNIHWPFPAWQQDVAVIPFDQEGRDGVGGPDFRIKLIELVQFGENNGFPEYPPMYLYCNLGELHMLDWMFHQIDIRTAKLPNGQPVKPLRSKLYNAILTAHRDRLHPDYTQGLDLPPIVAEPSPEQAQSLGQWDNLLARMKERSNAAGSNTHQDDSYDSPFAGAGT